MTSQIDATRLDRARRSYFGARIAAFRDLISLWAERRRDRRCLAVLNDALLRDIGLSRANAEVEAMKLFWMA